MAFGPILSQDPDDNNSNPHGIIKILGLDSGVMIKGNGTTNWAKIPGCTILGRITASNKLRPVGKAVLTAASAASTTVTVGVNNIQNVFVADAVKVISKLGVLGAVTAADLDGTPASDESVDLQGKHLDGLAHVVTITDPAGNSQALATSVTVDLSTGIETVNVSLQTDGAGASLTTITELIQEINENSGYIDAELAADATGSTVIDKAVAASFTLAGAVEVGGDIATGLEVVSRLDAGTMVLDTAVTAEIGDYVATEDGSDTAIGISKDDVVTLPLLSQDASPTHYDAAVAYMDSGIAYNPGVIGTNAETRADMVNIQFRDIVEAS